MRCIAGVRNVHTCRMVRVLAIRPNISITLLGSLLLAENFYLPIFFECRICRLQQMHLQITKQKIFCLYAIDVHFMFDIDDDAGTMIVRDICVWVASPNTAQSSRWCVWTDPRQYYIPAKIHATATTTYNDNALLIPYGKPPPARIRVLRKMRYILLLYVWPCPPPIAH